MDDLRPGRPRLLTEAVSLNGGAIRLTSSKAPAPVEIRRKPPKNDDLLLGTTLVISSAPVPLSAARTRLGELEWTEEREPEQG